MPCYALAMQDDEPRAKSSAERLQALMADFYTGPRQQDWADAAGVTKTHVSNLLAMKRSGRPSLKMADRWLAKAGRRLVLDTVPLDDAEAEAQRADMAAIAAAPAEFRQLLADCARFMVEAPGMAEELADNLRDDLERWRRANQKFGG